MENQPAFIGSIPEKYDRYMGPIFFEGYADDLAQRVVARKGATRVLELACGTGIVTRRLRDALPPGAQLVATDLHEPMLAEARRKFRENDRVIWKPADACALPFPDGAFDAIVCQFGVMFFPDKRAAFAEAYRVLDAGGTLLFNVWDSLEENELSLVAHETIASFFPADPPDFYATPFGFHDAAAIARMLAEAGFAEVEVTTVRKPGDSASAHDAAVGLVEGTPVVAQIAARGITDLRAIVGAVAAAIGERFGERPVRSTLSALVCTARKS